MDQNNIHNYNSSSNDCFNELISLTRPLFKQGFQSIYETVCNNNNTLNLYIFREFQEELQKVPSWNSIMIEKEYERFLASTRCEWLGDLIVANFKVSAKNILSSLQSTEKQDSIDLTVPLPQNFIHFCYIEIARLFWKKPQLFYHKHSITEKQLNDESIDKIIEVGIKRTINKNLPFNTLLKQSDSVVNIDSKETEPVHVCVDEKIDQIKPLTEESKEMPTLPSTPTPMTNVIEQEQQPLAPVIPSTPTPMTNVIEQEQQPPAPVIPSTPTPMTNVIEQEQQPFVVTTDHFQFQDKSLSTNESINELNDLSVSSPVVSLNRSASFVAPRRDSLDDESDDDTLSNVSDDSSSEDDMLRNQMVSSEKNNFEPLTNEFVQKLDMNTCDKNVIPTSSTEDVFKDTKKNINISVENDNTDIEENIIMEPESEYKSDDNETFHVDLNKTIKEIYINDKKRRNEKKIKKILGVKMNYDTYIQQDKRKLRNYLILNQNIPKA